MLPNFDPVQQRIRALRQALPRIGNIDGIAYHLARHTPRIISLALVLLLAGVVASRIELWVEGFLWGIPALGAASIGPGLLIWSANLAGHPDISPAARRALRRAMLLQLPMALAALFGLVYFVGMALRLW